MAGYDPITQTKFCTGCSERKPVSDFYRHNQGKRASYPDPFAHRCKACFSVEFAKRYKDNPALKERVRLYGLSERGKQVSREKQRRPAARARNQRRPEQIEKKRLYFKEYGQRPATKALARVAAAKRRALKASGGSFSRDDISTIKKLQRDRCAICRIKLPPNYHIDHITPLSKGGHSSRSNLQLLCPTCNQRKNNKDPIEYMQSLGRLL